MQHALVLEQRVAERTQELEHRNEALRRNDAELLAANTELDAFAYSVAHDCAHRCAASTDSARCCWRLRDPS